MTDIQGIEAELRSNGIHVESIEAGEPVDLTYMTAFPGREVDRGEVGRICSTFIDLYENERWEPTRIDATVVRSADDVLAYWHAEPEWIEDVSDGECSEVEFSTLVVETITYPDSSGQNRGEREPDDRGEP
ncbi:Uncharacterized protein AArcCO_2235 [Halalkaliarchaeum sp. AArc-CO]|uniref:hypothetical protein n=1 Tax=unclassified Halalkaliarchaeum TaxID=2678344 RepID=UPI00217D7438|nr:MULTISPECIES: hypothetical protein [unclassified Halalkaliarchaeum]MDR5672031.1 hypothetical protein [Halalkaliarchaeum sp. AArc-GB]UWG51529.1 Uncharacterized protein AArcCO_2235 [Halalkaliarchaeum sp. AArc-CO]